MNMKNALIALIAGMALTSGLAQATQTVDFANLTRNGAAATSPVFVVGGDVLKFDASLTANGASNPPGTTGLGLCLEYKQSLVNDPTIANLLQTDLFADGTPSPIANCTQGGATLTPGADTMVVKGWLHISVGGWPNVALPVKLYDAQFTVPSTPSGSTQVGFGASSVAAGQTFATNGPLVVCGKPTVTVTKTADGSETGPTPAMFDVSLSAPVPAECGTGGIFPVTLTLGGTATPTTDYAISGTDVGAVGSTVTVSFPADGAATTRSVVATPVDDNAVEGTETITLTVATGSGNYLGVGNTDSANITDNDASVSVAVTQNGMEGGPNGTFTFTRVGATAGALTVNFALTGSAATPADYSVSAGAGASAATTTSITFNPGATTAVLNVVVVDDVLIEGTETVILTVGAGAGYSITGTNPVTMNITDNDVPPVVSVSAKTDAAEPSTNGSFTITRATNLTPAVPLNFTVGGLATRGTDYTLSLDNCGTTLSANSLTIPASVATVTVTVCVIDDVSVEGTESVILTIAAPTSPNDYTIGAPSTQTVNIADDDVTINVSIAATIPNAAEPSTNGQFTVTRTSGSAAQNALPYVVNIGITGSATNGTDYQTIPPTVTILANQTTATIPVTVIDDAAVEGTETVIATVQAGTGYSVGAPSQATVNIADDDGPVTVSIAATTQAAEPSTNGLFTVTRNGGGAAQLAQPLVVNFAVTGTAARGTDYTLSTDNCSTTLAGNAVTIAASQTSAAVTVCVIDDVAVEGSESVILTLQSGSYTIGAPSAATVNIADDDATISVSIAATLPNAAEPSTNGQFTVTRTSGSAAQNALPYVVNIGITGSATNGTDYQTIPPTVTIPANQTTATIPVTVIDDAAIEGTETVIATVQAGTGYTVGAPSSATVNIADDEVPISVSIVANMPNAAEPGTNGQFTVTRTSGSAVQNAQTYVVNIGVGGTATNGTDYQTIANTVTIPANQTAATIPVTVIDDSTLEGNETVVLTVQAGSGYNVGAPSSATVTIADDEIGIGVTTLGNAAEGGASGVFRVCRTGSTASQMIVAFVLGGNAVQGSDYTLSGNAGNTIVIPAGTACADLTVTAVDDQVQNGNRDVTIALTPDQQVQLIPGEGEATMAIIDNDQPKAIPTLSTFGLMLLGLMLAAMAGFAVRRRRG